MPRLPRTPPNLDTRDPAGWINPYAYIPLAPEPSERGAPTAHDTFTGNSGWIDVTFTARSPIHTSEASNEAVLSFLKLDGRHVLAGASLKGLIRTSFERLTGSCLRVIDLDRGFSRRVELGNRGNTIGDHAFLVTGFRGDGAVLRRLVSYRVPIRPPRTGSETQNRLNDLTSLCDGDRVTFELVAKSGAAGTKNIAVNVEPYEDGAANERSEDGRLKLTDCKEDSNKQHQRVYTIGKVIGTVGKEVVDEYNRSIQASMQEDERRRRAMGAGEILPCNVSANEPDRWGARRAHHPLRKDDVVWGNDLDPAKVEKISPSRIHRTALRHRVADAVPEGFEPCATVDELCWACRVFGMVQAEKANRDHDQSFAGHVRVGWGYGPPAGDTTEVDLPPLLSPKPSFGAFSLLNHEAKRAPTWDDEKVEIGGYRAYWHRPTVVSGKPAERLGKRVQTLDTNTTFRCKVTFDNLSDADLGMLMCAIDPRRLGPPFANATHKFGMGKSVGLGSLEATVSGVTIIDRTARYSSLTDDATVSLTDVDIEGCASVGAGALDKDAAHLRSLAAVMNFANRYQTTYPGFTDADDKGYEWYGTHRGEPLAHPEQTIDRSRQSS